MNLFNKKAIAKFSFLSIKMAYTILFVGVVATLWSSIYTNAELEKEANTDFKLICSDINYKITSRLKAHSELLQSSSAIFSAFDTVSQDEWSLFNKYSKTKNSTQSVKIIGYSYIIPQSKLLAYNQRIKDLDLSTYVVKPLGNRDFYTTVLYLAPVTAQNIVPYGFDMYTEPIRRKAMEVSRDSGMTILTGKVHFDSNLNKESSSGVLMFTPVFKKNMPLDSLNQRRKAILGWVFSPYLMSDLMEGILGRFGNKSEKQIRLKIFDSNIPSERSLIFDSESIASKHHIYKEDRMLSFEIELNQKKWLLNFNQSKDHFFAFKSKLLIVFILGLIISILLFSLSISLVSTQQKAQSIAIQLADEFSKNELRFKNMFQEHDSIMLFIEPVTGQIIDANNSAALFYGYSIADLCTKSMTDINMLGSEQLIEQLEDAAVKNQNYFTLSHQLANGETRIVEVHASPIDYNGQKILFSIIHDITERRLAELAVLDGEERWKFAIEGSNDGLWDWDLENDEVYFSSQWKNMLGYQDHEISNHLSEWEKRIHPDDVLRTFSDIEEHINGDAPLYSSIHRIFCKDGSYKWILDRGKVVKYNKAGKSIRMIGVHTDMTERIKMEKRLKQLNEDKDRFLSIMAHDLRSPFNSILGFLQLIKSKINHYTIEQIERNITIVLQTAQNTYHLLDDLLNWSHAQANKIPYEPFPLDMQTVFDEVAGILKLNASNKNIEIEYVSSTDYLIVADKNMICTVLRNLISNAIKFTNIGGKIKVSVDLLSDCLLVCVQDNGIGIEKDVKNKLFDESLMNSTPGTENEKGTGFGLQLCKGFIDKHNGQIWVESTVGVGSRFLFSLPIEV